MKILNLILFVGLFSFAPFAYGKKELVVNPDTSEQAKKFEKIMDQNSWKLVFDDVCTIDWQKNWFLDGAKAHVKNSDKGMTLTAGPNNGENASHSVLWTKQEFQGPIRIEYDFTRLDSNEHENNVNILYILAQGSGKGDFDRDITKWSDDRTVPAMSIYFNHMQTYHISYAVNWVPYNNDYIRARRYVPETGKGLKGTALLPEYEATNLFKIGKTYRVTVIADHEKIYMNVAGDGQEKLFYFDIPKDKLLTKGRIGLRQMWTRISTYKNFKVYQGQ